MVFVLFLLLPTTNYQLLTTYAQTASLSLSPASGTFNKSCSFNLEIKLNTGGAQSDGTDAIVLYDQSKLTATNIAPGTIYPDYPGNNIDDNNGKVTISGLASVSSAFSGTGTLATISFTVKDTAASGATMVKFDFESGGKTTDSNVVERGTILDVLSSVTNGNYTIGTGSCGAGGATPIPSVLPGTGRGGPSTPSATLAPAPVPTPAPPITTLPPAGTEQLTYTIAIVGSVLTILGIFGLALL